jgi:hypothetical protein
MYTPVIILSIVFIAYGCIANRNLLDFKNILKLTIISVLLLIIVQSIVTIYNLNQKRLDTTIVDTYISINKVIYRDSANTKKVSFFKMSDDMHTIFINTDTSTVQFTDKVECEYDNCIIYPNSSFNYMAKATKYYIANNWVPKVALPIATSNFNIYMTSHEFKQLCTTYPKLTEKWTVKN